MTIARCYRHSEEAPEHSGRLKNLYSLLQQTLLRHAGEVTLSGVEMWTGRIIVTPTRSPFILA